MRLPARSPVRLVSYVTMVTVLVANRLVALGAPAPSPVALTVEPGFNGYCKANRWFPVAVELQNRGAAGEVDVEVRQQYFNNDVVPRSILHAQLPGASRRRYDMYVLPIIYTGGGRLVTEVGRQGETLLRQESTLRELGPGERLVVLMNSEEGALSLPSSIGPGNRGGPPAYGGPGGPPGQQKTPVHVASVKPENAPERWKGYDPVDLLVLGDVTEQSLSVPQQTAIREWVAMGGTLVISGGADVGRLRAGFYRELMPVDVIGTKSMAAGGLPSSVLTLARPRSAARILSPGGAPLLVVVGRKGLGQVYFVAFDVTRPPFRGSDAGSAIWRGILSDARGGERLLDLVSGQDEPGSGPYYYGGRAGLSDACYELSQLQAPPFGGIAFFLLAYILCLVPVNYAVLRRKDRKEWAWATTPAIVLVFTLFAYLFGYGTKGGQVLLCRIGIVEAWSGDGIGTSLGSTGLFSPRKTRYDVAVPAPAVVSPTPDSGNEGAVKLIHDDGMRLSDAAVDMWAMRLFQVEAPVALGSGVTVRWEGAGDQRKATFANGTPYDLEECAYLGRLGGRKVSLAVGKLPRGASHTLGAVQRGGGHLDLLVPAEPSPTSRDSIERMKYVLRRAVGQDGHSFETPLLVGWTRQPLFRMTVDGRQVREENLTLVVIHLTGGEVGNG